MDAIEITCLYRISVNATNGSVKRIVHEGENANDALIFLATTLTTLKKVGLVEYSNKTEGMRVERGFNGILKETQKQSDVTVVFEAFTPNELQVINAELIYLNLLKRMRKDE